MRTSAMLGKFIERQRVDQSLTQEYLASKLGISRPTYRKIESGDREPTLSEAERLAEEFDMTLADLHAQKAPKHEMTVKESARKQTEPQSRVRKKDLAKFRQVLLYVLDQVGGKPHVDETVLHKLLYFIDFDYYEKYEENLAGVTYIRNHYGPAVRGLGDILKQMQEQGQLMTVKSKHFTHVHKKYLPLVPPDLSILSARELQHIDEVLARLGNKNASELEAYSHGDIPWRSTASGEAISYERVFYRDEKYSVRHYDEL